jgi:hypothetical protein
MAVALMEKLGQLLAVELEPTLTFEQPTSRALADHLLDLVGAMDAGPLGEDATAPVPVGPPREASPERTAVPTTVLIGTPTAVSTDTFGTELEENRDDGLAELSDDDLTHRLLDRIARSEALLNEVL